MRRNPNFDVIRAILALSIVFIHALYFAGINRGGPWGALGRYTVDGFIVLSGYVICKMLLLKQEPYNIFIWRRFLRLFPAFLVCLSIALILRPVTLGSNPPDLRREASELAYYWPHILAHLTMLHGAVPTAVLPVSCEAFLPTAWSISLELQLYLLAPLILWLLLKFGWPAYAVIGSASLVPVAVGQFHALLLSFVSERGSFLPQKFYFFLFGMIMCLSWKAVWMQEHQSIRLLPIPGAPALEWIGLRSYSLFLVHYPVMSAMHATILRGSGWANAGLTLFLGGGLSLALADLLYRYVELPGIALGKGAKRALKN